MSVKVTPSDRTILLCIILPNEIEECDIYEPEQQLLWSITVLSSSINGNVHKIRLILWQNMHKAKNAKKWLKSKNKKQKQTFSK